MSSTSVLSDRDIVILYVDDSEQQLERWLAYIRDNWSHESKGVRSVEAAMELIKTEDFKPDFAILDIEILRRENDALPTQTAGADLYHRLIRFNIPVVIITGVEGLAYREPYRSNPPLAILTIPIGAESFQKASEIYMKYVKGRTD